MLDPLTSRGYKCRLNAERMIVSIICIAGDLPETVVFGDPAVAPEATLTSCASSTVPRVFNRRPKLYITDYFNKPTE